MSESFHYALTYHMVMEPKHFKTRHFRKMPLLNEVIRCSFSVVGEIVQRLHHLKGYQQLRMLILNVQCNRTETLQDISLSQDAFVKGGNIMQLQRRKRLCLEISSPIRPLTIEEMAAEICDSIPEPEEMNDETETNVISHPTIDGIAKNRIYQTKELLKTSIALYAIQNRFQFKVYRSDRKEYVLKCLDDKCTWSFRASRIGEMDKFKIRYMKNSHTCKLDVVLRHHRQATSSFVASCIKYNSLSPKTIYTPGDIMKDMMNTYGVWMSYEKAWRAREQALLKNRAVLAPTPKRRPGRPKGKGIPSAEGKEQITRCGRCGEFGHNRRSCKTSSPIKSKSDRKRKSPDSLTWEVTYPIYI